MIQESLKNISMILSIRMEHAFRGCNKYFYFIGSFNKKKLSILQVIRILKVFTYSRRLGISMIHRRSVRMGSFSPKLLERLCQKLQLFSSFFVVLF